MRKLLYRWIFAIALTFGPGLAAKVRLPAIFSDHAVLAKKAAVPIFGYADPGEKVTVTFHGQTKETVADRAGFWQVELDLSASPAEPSELRVNDLVVRDVVVGGLFLASGQSNMTLRLWRTLGFAEAVRRPPDPKIRCFEVSRRVSYRPLSPADLRGRWTIAAPNTVGDFSALAYEFARAVSAASGEPVGVIHSSVGGTSIHAWTDAKTIQAFPATARVGRERVELFESYPEKFRVYRDNLTAWEKKFHRSAPPLQLPGPTAQWSRLAGRQFPGNGVIWLKARVELSPAWAKNGFNLHFENFRVPSVFYLDDKLVLDNRLPALRQEYYVSARTPGGKFAPGGHDLLVRIHASREATVRPPAHLTISGKELSPEWSIWREQDFGALSAAARKALPSGPGARIRQENLWSHLFNGMIHPLAPCALTGILWYQGEGNAEQAREYGKLFPALITGWRKLFRDPELPFYFCLLAAYRDKSADAGFDGDFARLRNAQMLALSLPHTAMVVLSDAGESRDIHPADKLTPGSRLAALALHEIYKRDVPCRSPVATHAECRKGVVTVHFANTYGGLAAAPLPSTFWVERRKNLSAPLLRNSPEASVEGFALADANGNWHWADRAEIAGDTVVVSSARAPQPSKIRFGWGDNPTCNLVNSAGLPAAPFQFFLREK